MMGLDDSRQQAWKEMQARNIRMEKAAADSPEVPLKGGGGDGTSGGMTIPIKDYIDARDASVRSDISSEISALRADISKLPTTWTLIATALAIVSILIAVLAFGGARFSAGISLADQRQAQLTRDAAQDAAAHRSESKLDEILKRLPKQP